MSETVIIDFQQRGYEGRVYSGRPRGELARRELGIDRLDAATNVDVEVRVPDKLYGLTSSFFLGLFGPSLNFFGSKEAFQKKYKIIASRPIMEEIDEYIETELRRNQSR
ncbi:hypothetical protein IB268_24835 [Achromobacter sp. ACM01]|uniref:hypothetical protein n=1 Tax=Achromobacter sp. ACM01 TaxID=2769298 RepID=UPI00177B3C0A|nr:hypothetical protein [Achromobacter sp. ACM01]MBD9476163.1 hypothetical protein [Achromobacter sp. ACM01]